MNTINLPLQLAPNALQQSILPGWDFSFFNINLGTSSHPEMEYQILEKVGSYGVQLGHLAEALEVVIKHTNTLEQELSQSDRDAIQIFLGDVAKVRSIKVQSD